MNVLKPSVGHIGLLLICVGCVPVPFASPPMRSEIAPGTSSHPKDANENSSAFTVPIRAGLYPLQVSRSLRDRKFDAGGGYQIWIGSNRVLDGPYLDFAYHAPINSVVRFRTSLKPQMMTPRGAGWGFGGGLQIGFDFLAFAHGPFSGSGHDSFFFGAAKGEGGMGLFLEATHITFGEESTTFFGFGITILVPASLGVGVVFPDW